mmetsp:Transcript_25869/g.49166  ORF Transcript_25869/g.49166 Transcript_25869/m.49166 type:complete len:177 (+) Transcript_25869:151-681(+)|eukprot:CAMPEP_0114224796 /NCGR_PEP_ID=MMETSP0058-20121206/304_1 /TAXON_ID=36894 /ORGANISM="Pyramimonas parkeae, CCMP726" /LENGTH=176 /DNA_ID=CAMNT_0001335307 /DNA_START=151 /DNA_END=681 /DNA_ORIENTATION=-
MTSIAARFQLLPSSASRRTSSSRRKLSQRCVKAGSVRAPARTYALLDSAELVHQAVLNAPSEVMGQLAAASSNLGFLDPGSGPPPADWDYSSTKDLQSFEPGVRVDPKGIFASAVLGIFCLDATLESMKLPSIQRFVRESYRKDRLKKRELEVADLKRQLEEQQRLQAESKPESEG